MLKKIVFMFCTVITTHTSLAQQLEFKLQLDPALPGYIKQSSCAYWYAQNSSTLFGVRSDFPHVPKYSVEIIEKAPVRDQANYGSCWIYSAITALEDVAKQRGLDLDLSENYLIKKSLELRTLMALQTPGYTVEQGGFLNWAESLIQIFGIIPENSWKSPLPGGPFGKREYSEKMMFYINGIIGSYHEQVAKYPDNQKELFEKAKNDVKVILTFFFGEEPHEFVHKGEKFTPRQFAKKFLPDDLLKKKTIRLDPIRPALDPSINKIANAQGSKKPPEPLKDFFRIENANQFEARKATFTEIAQVIQEQLEKNLPVVVSFEVERNFIDRKTGIMSISAFNNPIGFQPPSMRYRRAFDLNGGGHQVEVVGIDLDPVTGKPIKLKIKNSWSTEMGDMGYYHMYWDYALEYLTKVYIRE